jgi:DNA-binding transcriptional MocR family regulator
MALTATKAVWKHSEATGNARLVLLALADHVNEQRVQVGDPWEAWPSQNTLARICNCSRSSVKRALEELRELGEIEDTGERKLRGTVVYEILPDLLPDMAHSGPGGAAENVDLAHSAPDLAHSGTDLAHSEDYLAHSGPPPGSTVNHKPEENQKLEPEERTRREHRSAPPAAETDDVSSPVSDNGADPNNPDSTDLPADPQVTQAKQPQACREAEENEILDELAGLRDELADAQGLEREAVHEQISLREAELDELRPGEKHQQVGEPAK